MSATIDDAANKNNDKINDDVPVAVIAASRIRSGLAELEFQTSQVLQRLESVKATSALNNNNDNKETEGTETATDSIATDTSAPTYTNSIENVVNHTTDGEVPNTTAPMAAANAVAKTMSAGPLKQPHLLSVSRQPSEILKSLEELVSYADNDDDPEFPLPALDDVSHLALISHSIVAYLSHLDRQQLMRITDTIAGDTTRWLSALFRFSGTTSSFHVDNADAMLRIVRLAITAHNPGYPEIGMAALMQPCCYISENTTSMRLQYACRQLGIPLESIRIIPANSTFGTMDLTALQKQIQSDLASHRTPILVIADVGASMCGYVDNLIYLRDICRTHNMWLHANGHGIAALACLPNAPVAAMCDIVHSMALNMGSWLGLPSLPIVILHRQLQKTSLSAFESDPILSRRLNALSLWTALQALGEKSIAERIHVAFQTCYILFEIVSKCSGVRVLSHAPGAQSGSTLTDLINATFDVVAVFDSAAPVVVYQFDGSTKIEKNNHTSALESENSIKPLEKSTNPSYFDRLNSWLGQILQRDCPNFDFEVVETIDGTCIRFCPLELGLGEQPPTSDSLEQFAQSLEAHVDILRATIKHKAKFIQLVEDNDLLRLVNLPDWAGMGGVRFVPEGWETLLTDQAKTELNKLNIDLVESLKSTDNAFSLGEDADGLICVRFGMVTHETEVEELLDLVVSVGKSVQENSRVLDTMSEIVKKGIEAATADLQRETEEKLWQEGILRHVPVVGRVFNWLSPPSNEAGIRGRSLNLTQGVVESTENIYKYHMQIGGIPAHQLPANRSPPTPKTKTTVTRYNDELNSGGDGEHVTPIAKSIEASQNAVLNGIEGGSGSGGAAAALNGIDIEEGISSNHARSMSQSSAASSHVGELGPVNNSNINKNNN